MFREMKFNSRQSYEKLKDKSSPADADLLRRSECSIAPSPHFYDFVRTLRLDYDHELAVVVVPEGQTEIFGVARLVYDRKNATGNFAIAFPSIHREVRSVMVEHMMGVARLEGLKTVTSITAKDAHVLHVAQEFGFELTELEHGLVFMEKKL